MRDAECGKRSFAAGYLMGLSGLPAAAAPAQLPSEPTMCLYNGMLLPYLKWDEETFAHALVTFDCKLLEFKLVIYKKADYYTIETPIIGGTFVEPWFGSEEENSAIVFSCKPGETSWIQTDKTNYSVYLKRYSVMVTRGRERVIWANFNLLFDDSTPYVNGSAPEPIANAEAFNGKNCYNAVVLPPLLFSNVGSDEGIAIMKHETEDLYVLFWYSNKFQLKSVADGISVRGGDRMGVYTCPAGGDSWKSASYNNYVKEEYDPNNNYPQYSIGKFENLVWTLHDMTELAAVYTSMPGSDPVPVVIPESAPGAVTDNKMLMLGCRLGHLVRTHSVSGGSDVPAGVLVSSDGFILRDSNGLYLTGKDDT